MKKRVKLLTTIASLCLAVALMAFGVYAADTAVITTQSTVTFVTNNVQINYTVTVVHTTGVNVKDADSLEGYEADKKTLTLTGSQALQNPEKTTHELLLGDYTFDPDTAVAGENASTITYTINITTEATGVKYDVALENAVTAGEYGGVTVAITDAAETTMDSTAGVTYIVTYTMTNTSVDIPLDDESENKLTFNPQFTITKSANQD